MDLSDVSAVKTLLLNLGKFLDLLLVKGSPQKWSFEWETSIASAGRLVRGRSATSTSGRTFPPWRKVRPLLHKLFNISETLILFIDTLTISQFKQFHSSNNFTAQTKAIYIVACLCLCLIGTLTKSFYSLRSLRNRQLFFSCSKMFNEGLLKAGGGWPRIRCLLMLIPS